MNFVFVVNRANLYTDIWIRCQQVGQWSVPWNSCSRALHWLTEAVTNQASDALKSNIECALMRADMFSQAKVNTRPYTHTHTSVCARYFHADVGACADIDVLLSVYSSTPLSPSFMILEAVMLSWSPETSQQPRRSRTQPLREEEGGGGEGEGGG